MRNRILVIGGSGQLGSEIRRQAPDHWQILAPTRHELDAFDAGALANAVQEYEPDLVLNCSAFHVVDLCETRFSEALAINAVAVQALARACASAQARLVTVSTDYVFDGAKSEPYSEEDRTNPLQAYGISKVAGESAALAAHPEGTLVVRSCGLYGSASSRQKAGNFVLNRLRDACEMQLMEVGSDLVCTPTSAADLASAILSLLSIDAPAGIYHATNSGCCNWAEFTVEIFKRAGISTEVVPVDRRGAYGLVRRPPYSVLDAGKIRSLGVAMRPWQDALEDYLKGLEPA